jgi:DNA-binding response OmpR family regulator
MHHILVVDDDRTITKLLNFLLTDEGYKVSIANGPNNALALLEKETYDLIILDIMMPGIDGLELGRRIRETSTTPIIFVSALGEVKDRITGLKAGGDDYITKPFDPSEMLARTWAVLRRNGQLANSESSLKTPDFNLNPIDNEVTLVRSGKTVSLTPIEARLLRVLASNPGRTLTRDMIIVKVWGYEYEGESNQLDVYIKRLRSKIEENASDPKLLVTMRGVGYRYQPSVSRATPPPMALTDASRVEQAA